MEKRRAGGRADQLGLGSRAREKTQNKDDWRSLFIFLEKHPVERSRVSMTALHSPGSQTLLGDLSSAPRVLFIIQVGNLSPNHPNFFLTGRKEEDMPLPGRTHPRSHTQDICLPLSDRTYHMATRSCKGGWKCNLYSRKWRVQLQIRTSITKAQGRNGCCTCTD